MPRFRLLLAPICSVFLWCAGLWPLPATLITPPLPPFAGQSRGHLFAHLSMLLRVPLPWVKRLPWWEGGSNRLLLTSKTIKRLPKREKFFFAF
uniref:Putative secreted protein n=1 Tax=Anopheles darlingi TaxID=43151 RepID=A0A2M4DMI5_ANODA